MPNPVLVFDMDGVLVDPTESYRRAIRETVKYFTGRDVGNAAIQDLKNAGGWSNDWDASHKLIRDLGFEIPYDSVVAQFQAVFLGNGDDGLIRQERWLAEPGLLDRLSSRYRLAVFTGRPRKEALLSLARFAPQLRFDPIIADEDVENGKPAPDGLRKIAALTRADRIWYAGDTVDDARSAKAAGVAFIGIASEWNPRRTELVSLFNTENAAAVLENINQLESVL